MTPPLRQDVTGCLATAVGAGGVTERALAALLAEAAPALACLRRWRDAQSQPFLTLPARRDDLPALRALADGWRARYDRLVVLGTGGASLGGQALAATGGAAERLLFLDNGDGARLDRVLRAPGLDGAGFLVVTKSGATAETLAQALLVLDAAPPPARVTLLTGPGDSPARRLATRFGLPLLEHDPALPGRLSALSAMSVSRSGL